MSSSPPDCRSCFKRGLGPCIQRAKVNVSSWENTTAEKPVGIALLEDDPLQAELMIMWLRTAGHGVHHYTSGDNLLDDIRRQTFDLVLVYWNTPGMRGPEVLVRLREYKEHRNWQTPVLFLTARGGEEEIVFALRNGADDYITTPVRQDVALARIDAMTRPPLSVHSTTRTAFPPYMLDGANQIITKQGRPISLSRREYKLAVFLFGNRGRLLSRGDILRHVWSNRSEPNARIVDKYVSRLRYKLGLNPASGWRLKCLYGHGYRLVPVYPN